MRSLGFLQDDGYILSSEFYVNSKIPLTLIRKAEKIFGITPTTVGYKEVMGIYEGLDVLYEDRNELIPETEIELQHYCESTISRACNMQGISDLSTRDMMFQRLYEIKLMSNLLRPYQNYNVLVLRYRKSTYPNRYVELF